MNLPKIIHKIHKDSSRPTVDIKIMGVPIAQPRHRSSIVGKKVRQYNPVGREKVTLEHTLQWVGATKYRPLFDEYPCFTAFFKFGCKIPACTLKRDLKLIEKELLYHEKKPDTDNVIKFYLDALEPVFGNDNKAQLGMSIKVKSNEPYTHIVLIPHHKELSYAKIAEYHARACRIFSK